MCTILKVDAINAIKLTKFTIAKNIVGVRTLLQPPIWVGAVNLTGRGSPIVNTPGNSQAIKTLNFFYILIHRQRK